jgi:hypothetical protein
LLMSAPAVRIGCVPDQRHDAIRLSPGQAIDSRA